MNEPFDDFAGKRILIVEDESILAMSLEDLLDDLGFRVVGPALTICEALRLIGSEPLDAAVLDINLGDEPSFDIARLLAGKNVPFCFSTGYGAAGVADDLSHVPVLQKPYTRDALHAVLARILIDA